MAALPKLFLLFACAALFALLAACDGNAPPTPTPIPLGPGPTAPPDQAGDMPVRILDRDLDTQNFMLDPRGTPFTVLTPIPNMEFELEFTNRTGKDLKSFRGALIFQDTQGTEIERFTPRFEQELKAGETAVIKYPIIDNQYVKERQSLKAASVPNLVVLFRPTSFTFADGTTQLIEATPTP